MRSPALEQMTFQQFVPNIWTKCRIPRRSPALKRAHIKSFEMTLEMTLEQVTVWSIYLDQVANSHESDVKPLPRPGEDAGNIKSIVMILKMTLEMTLEQTVWSRSAEFP